MSYLCTDSQGCHRYTIVKLEHTSHPLNGTNAGANPQLTINFLHNSVTLDYILHATGKGS